MLLEVIAGEDYISPSGLRFHVLHLGKHAQDCSLPMVVFTNLTPTHDQPAGEIWVIAESLFLKQFRTVEDANESQVSNT